MGHLERSWLPGMQGTAQKTPHGSFSTPCAPYWYTPKSLWPSCTSINYRAVSWWPCRAQSEIISGNICSSWSPARQFHCIESRQFQNSPLYRLPSTRPLYLYPMLIPLPTADSLIRTQIYRRPNPFLCLIWST